MKLECVPKFCYLGDTHGAGGGVEEAARARCAWAKFKELLSLILTARGVPYVPHKGIKIYARLVARVHCHMGLKPGR